MLLTFVDVVKTDSNCTFSIKCWASCSYHISGIFCCMYISRLSMEPGFSLLKFNGWRLSKGFCIFAPCYMAKYVRITHTILSEIDKAPYQIVYHSWGNPRSPCGNSWESVLSWAVKVGSMIPLCLSNKK